MERTRLGQDFGAGAMFIAFGGLGLYIARDYATGSALRMGPGYVPHLLCWLMIAVGAVVALRGLLTGDTPVARWYLRPLVFVLGGLMVFRYLIELGGLLFATLATVLLGAYGSQEFRLRDSLLLAFGLGIGAVGVFVYALGLPMTIWPF